MSNFRITQLPEDTAPTADDLIVTVNDPGGTPVNRRVTIGNLLRNLPDGSSGAPALAFGGEQTLGIYRPGAGQLSIMGGNVGIGTTVPVNRLHVEGLAGALMSIRSTLATDARIEFHRAGVRIGLLGWNANELIFEIDTAQVIMFSKKPSGEMARITSDGNVGIGTSTFGTGAARVLGLADGTPPTSSPADMVQLWSEPIGGVSELRVRDEAGNVTTLSPHPSDFLNTLPETIEFPSVYHSSNVFLGKEIYIDFVTLAKEVERLTEAKIIYLRDIPKQDWDENQEALRLAREAERQQAMEALANLEHMISLEEDEIKKEELQKAKDSLVIPEPYVKKEAPKWLKKRIMSQKPKKKRSP